MDFPQSVSGPPPKKRSPWFYVAIGCGGLLVLSILVGGALTFFAVKKVSGELEKNKDPVARAARTQELLGYERPPEGYSPALVFGLGDFIQVAILTDKPGEVGKGEKLFDRRGFIFVSAVSDDRRESRMDDYFEGRDNRPGLPQANTNVQVKEIIGRGVASTSGGAPVRYVTQRGEVSTQQTRNDGLFTLMRFDCPDAGKLRLGIWLGEDPDPAADLGSLDLKGTVVDEAAIKAFAQTLNPCR